MVIFRCQQSISDAGCMYPFSLLLLCANIRSSSASARTAGVAHSPVAMPQLLWHAYVVSTQEDPMAEAKLDLLQGTLDLMVLQTLQAMGAMHGYGIARRIEQVSGDEI